MGQKRRASIENSPEDITLRPEFWPDAAHRDDDLKQTDLKFKNLYSKPSDFRQLARRDPDFAAVVKGRELDFSDPASVVQLTKTLLKLDFGLQVELPHDRLCPPVPNRHNYILWLKGLLDTSSYSPPGQKLLGLDIGTGASCIYPLLGCSQRPWSFIATDIDAQSLVCARNNVDLNGLAHRIRVVERRVEDCLVPIDDLGLDSIDFTMTNPPFYESEDAMVQSSKSKSRPPCTACTGSRTEMVVEGGEVAFVRRILNESLILRNRVQWYSSMLGFLSSVTTLVTLLREHGICNYAITEFVQGKKTRRWAIAWSFGPMRPSQSVARGTKAASTKMDLLPVMTEVEVIKLTPTNSIGDFAARLSGAIGSLDLICWEWDSQALEGSGRTAGKVWGRAWRRRKKRETESAAEQTTADSDSTRALGFRVQIHVGMKDVAVRCRWIEGLDASTFESFRGFILESARSAATSPQPSKP
ncbi:hypothetical protein HIM_00973 [Hirsutella minnesotensis 3608]|nr:hypothetical protein HIM_00973 [Hirsutella minnesotensis 3608]